MTRFSCNDILNATKKDDLRQVKCCSSINVSQIKLPEISLEDMPVTIETQI